MLSTPFVINRYSTCMTPTSPTGRATTPHSFAEGYFFGVPFGNLGWFGSLLIGVAAGFITFFAATFCSIVFILFYNLAAHNPIDFAVTYRYIGLPAGLIVLAFALTYLGRLWIKRVFRHG